MWNDFWNGHCEMWLKLFQLNWFCRAKRKHELILNSNEYENFISRSIYCTYILFSCKLFADIFHCYIFRCTNAHTENGKQWDNENCVYIVSSILVMRTQNCQINKSNLNSNLLNGNTSKFTFTPNPFLENEQRDDQKST